MASDLPKRGHVWELRDSWDQALKGYLVTETEEHPETGLVAYVAAWASDPKTEAEALAFAERVAAGYRLAKEDAFRSIDLSEYGRVDSSHPVPLVFFGNVIGRVDTSFYDSRPFMPFCRFAMIALAVTHNRLQMGSAEWLRVKPLVRIVASRMNDSELSWLYDAGGTPLLDDDEADALEKKLDGRARKTPPPEPIAPQRAS